MFQSSKLLLVFCLQYTSVPSVRHAAACDPVSNEPFPYTLASCTCLCPAKRIQETLPPKRSKTYRFRLEQVGFLTCWLPDGSKAWTSFFLIQKVDILIELWFAIIKASSATLSTNAGIGHYARVVHECSAVRACFGAACDPVSNEPFPYTLASCTGLCPAKRIQETLPPKRGKTYRFRLEQVGFLTCWLPDGSKAWTSFFLIQKVDILIEVWFAIIKASSARVPRVLGQTNAAGTGIIDAGARSWMLTTTDCCRLSSSPFLKQTFAHVRLQAARGCALQIASKKLVIDERKGGRTICCVTARTFLTCCRQGQYS